MGSYESKVISRWGKEGNKDGEFNGPFGIDTDLAAGLVYIADTDNDRVQVFNEEGTFLRKVNGTFDHPTRVIAGPINTINKDVIDALHATPQLSSFPPGILPICAAYVGDTGVYVVDEDAERIQIFTHDNTFIKSIEHKEFIFANIAIGPDGRIYTTPVNWYIHVYDGEWHTIDLEGAPKIQYSHYMSLVISDDGKLIYISILGVIKCHRIADGGLVWQIHTQDSDNSPLSYRMVIDGNILYLLRGCYQITKVDISSITDIMEEHNKYDNNAITDIAKGRNGLLYAMDVYSNCVIMLKT